MHTRVAEHGWPFRILLGTRAVPTEPDGNSGMPPITRRTYTAEVIGRSGLARTLVGRFVRAAGPALPAIGGFEVLSNDFALPSSLIVGDYEIVSNVDFVVGAGVAATAANIATAIGRLPGFAAGAVGPVVAVNYDAGARDVVELGAKNFGAAVNFGNFVRTPNFNALIPGNPGYAPPLIA